LGDTVDSSLRTLQNTVSDLAYTREATGVMD